MLARIKRETQGQQAAADADRLEPLRFTATLTSYSSYLTQIYGFEAPIESAFLGTSELGQLADLRWRSQVRLLRSDLAALGIVDPTKLPTTLIPRFATLADAFGWMYVVEQSAVAHGQLHRHFSRWLPHPLVAAGCYLVGGERGVQKRLNELGVVLDSYATKPEIATKIVDAARIAFRRQRLWFGRGLPAQVSSSGGSVPCERGDDDDSPRAARADPSCRTVQTYPRHR